MKQHIFSYWDGPVSWLERLSVASILAHGHSLTVYSYYPEELAKLDLHSDIRDAREIIPESDNSYRYIPAKRYTLFTNIFRLVGQMQSIGLWVDLDCIFLKPCELEDDYVFGWLSDVKLNGAVLKLPADAAMTKDYYSGISADPLRTPWSTLRRRLYREFEIRIGRTEPSLTTRTNIGPRALTYYATRHDKMSCAQDKAVFYPLRSGEAPHLTTPDDSFAKKSVTEKTILMHAWQGRLKRENCLEGRPVVSSYLGQYCAKYDI